MGTYTIKQYQQVMRKRADALRKGAIKSASKAASFMQATAIKLAPRQTGTLIAGIKKTKLKGAQYKVESRVPGVFKYNMWVNQTAPFRSVKMIWNDRNSTVYGDGSHRITGTPRFFHIAALRTQQKFRKLARENTRKALGVKIG